MEKLLCINYDIEVEDLFKRFKRFNDNNYFNDFKIKRNYSKSRCFFIGGIYEKK